MPTETLSAMSGRKAVANIRLYKNCSAPGIESDIQVMRDSSSSYRDPPRALCPKCKRAEAEAEGEEDEAEAKANAKRLSLK